MAGVKFFQPIQPTKAIMRIITITNINHFRAIDFKKNTYFLGIFKKIFNWLIVIIETTKVNALPGSDGTGYYPHLP